MPLGEEFERTGGWLFRWRSYLPLIVLGLILLGMHEYRYPAHSETFDHLWEVFCLGVSFFGLAIRVFTIGHAPRGTSGRNTRRQIAETLNTTGIYSVVRNPLYLGNFFMGLGIALFPFMWWLTLIYVLAFWLYYERIIFAEEAFLRKEFGRTFLEWAESTPAFIPRLAQYRSPALGFSLRTVLRREYNGLLAIVLGMFAMELTGELVVEGRPDLDIGWVVLLVAILLIWVVLRALKKRSTLLDVPNR